ncbi:hypothetical protein [Peptoniphilus porci]|uniref:Uncharacterized protein n=1 Tax=Peptoniphilus porci TaxID=2652280 RepID=A0A1U7LX62_9FIRM|nr:hypothetical protein [Peptoniphilus porci]OLR61633.1 hypothetical protein BIV18_09780 [Peptoniphilus porci]
MKGKFILTCKNYKEILTDFEILVIDKGVYQLIDDCNYWSGLFNLNMDCQFTSFVGTFCYRGVYFDIDTSEDKVILRQNDKFIEAVADSDCIDIIYEHFKSNYEFQMKWKNGR